MLQVPGGFPDLKLPAVEFARLLCRQLAYPNTNDAWLPQADA
jgi:hypothetical protein